ncbi:MAG: lipoate--protein ligase family protein [Ignavibacteriales bacterium]|nr:lipoate--protein ligase family protein [Ignavibacteriales bacterium]
MRRDVALAEDLVHGTGSPTLRVYGWKPHTISLGYNQRRHDFDEERCRHEGIDIVRRPTGGRAIFHANELTYCVVMEAGGRSIQDVYAEISNALVAGLRFLGAQVEYAIAQPDLPHLYRQQTSIPCFASSSRYEIQYEGKKLVGSAQRRYTREDGSQVVLQHGSLLLGPEHRRLHSLLNVDDDAVTETILSDLKSKTTELSTVLGRRVEFAETAAAIKHGFEQCWNIVFKEVHSL